METIPGGPAGRGFAKRSRLFPRFEPRRCFPRLRYPLAAPGPAAGPGGGGGAAAGLRRVTPRCCHLRGCAVSPRGAAAGQPLGQELSSRGAAVLPGAEQSLKSEKLSKANTISLLKLAVTLGRKQVATVASQNLSFPFFKFLHSVFSLEKLHNSPSSFLTSLGKPLSCSM